MGRRLKRNKLRKWSIDVRRKDGKQCQICGSRWGRLQAHHIYDKSNHPEMAYDLINGVTLCSSNRKDGHSCHVVFHNVFKGGYRRKCTLKDWERFKKLIKWVKGW